MYWWFGMAFVFKAAVYFDYVYVSQLWYKMR